MYFEIYDETHKASLAGPYFRFLVEEIAAGGVYTNGVVRTQLSDDLIISKIEVTTGVYHQLGY